MGYICTNRDTSLHEITISRVERELTLRASALNSPIVYEEDVVDRCQQDQNDLEILKLCIMAETCEGMSR